MFQKIIAFLSSMFLTLAFTMNRAFTGENNPFHEITIRENHFAAENEFISMKREHSKLPTFQQERDRLPKPTWKGHDNAIECYYKAWELAFKNLKKPSMFSGYVSNYIDTAFDGNLFMWDSVFILMFGRYGARSFNFQGTLDNFYSHQYKDGYICRDMEQDTCKERFTRYDPSATGPEVMAWSEWEYYKNFGDTERLRKVFPCLMAYHEWMQANHTWPDGTYWSSGLGCGMDNLPRVQPGYDAATSHGHMIWNDACMQALLDCRVLIEMAKVLGREADAAGLVAERDHLMNVVNERLWDEKTAFYYDVWKDGNFNNVKHLGAYWALLAEAVPENRADAFIAHLTNENEFATPCMLPALSKDHPAFQADGGYWCGGVWAPTSYMTLRGLDLYGRYDLSHRIGLNYLTNVVSVFNDTGTVYENYAPMPDANGKPRQGSVSHADFVGWTGVVPISVLFEYVFGIKPDAQSNVIRWYIDLTDQFGVENYPFGKDATLSLQCAARESTASEPQVEIRSDKPVTVQIFWNGASQSKTITVGN